MPLLSEVGLVMVAFGALSGWLVDWVSADAQRARNAGFVQPRRILQGHLELIIMGGLFVAAGLAVEAPPAWLVALLVYGGWVAPLLFWVIARAPGAAGHYAYRVADRSSLVALSVGWAGLAYVGIVLR